MTKIRSHKNRAINLQKHIAQKISDLIDLPIGLDLDIQSRQMGQCGTDVVLSEKAKQLFPFGVECKSTKKFQYQYIKDAIAYDGYGLRWLLFWKRVGLRFSKTLVFFSWSTFCAFYELGIDCYIEKRKTKESKRWDIDKWVDFNDPKFFLIVEKDNYPTCMMFTDTFFNFLSERVYCDKENKDPKFPWVER